MNLRINCSRTIMVVGILFVNAANAAIVSAKGEPDFAPLISDLLSKGEETVLESGRAKVLSVDYGTRVRELYIEEKDSADGNDHFAELVLKGKKGDKVEMIVLSTSSPETASESVANYYIFTPKGKLKRAYIARVRIEDGKTVRGSGTTENLSISAANVKQDVQYELDFWLKGMYRKAK